MDMTRTIRMVAALAAVALAGAGCKSKSQEAPDLSGPSVLATSITVSATPDTLRQDGSSQASVVILALDANSQPVRNLPVRVDVAVGGVVADFGQVSAKNVVTGSDGRASLVYTAPNPPADSVDQGTVIQILATPTGSNYANATSRAVSIRLVPPGVILPPNGTPVPRFTITPSSPQAKSDVTFDASTSTDSDGQIVQYQWNFGDGTTGTGAVTRHQFAAGGNYTVVLTVVDDRGYSASLSKQLFVNDNSNPVADFVFSPTTPRANEDIFFNASASRAGTGRQIVSYAWDFGTGRTGSGVTVSKTYGTAGAYVVTLVVTDDVGAKGTTSKTVPVTAGSLVAAFVYSPDSPSPRESVFFDASTSSAAQPRTIVSYDWNFGDGASGSGKTVNHSFGSVGSYSVTLTVRDDIGQSQTASKLVTVSAGDITAGFTFSPNDPLPGDTVFFNGGDSSSPFGITRYDWNFGDGNTFGGGPAAARTATHSYAGVCPGGANDVKFVVRLTVRDGMDRTATATKDVTVKTCR
jgi:PKD repeat protein